MGRKEELEILQTTAHPTHILWRLSHDSLIIPPVVTAPFEETQGNTVSVPKIHWTFCKSCGQYRPHKVTQYKKGKDTLHAQGKQCYIKKQRSYDLRECWLSRDANILNWERIRRERAK
ncbi:hypothetical protein HPG69_006872 [Diceros bicornis minor]|uniref:Uncharacterized protein n=1 Tax=Diceros bicornis minor TaxID=77932 RepID=A0A7J7ERV9_DICBM|nr:hypothetical protein HPG69_006872 [Diceros bicornis minor]